MIRNTGRFSVNIREIPDINGKIIASLKAGDEASGIGRSSESTWIYIEYGDINGWVSSELVEILLPVESLPVLIAPKQAP